MPPPTGLITTAGDHEGEIDLSWKKVTNAKSYTIQFSPDPPTPESRAHHSPSFARIEKLTSGKRWPRPLIFGESGREVPGLL